MNKSKKKKINKLYNLNKKINTFKDAYFIIYFNFKNNEINHKTKLTYIKKFLNENNLKNYLIVSATKQAKLLNKYIAYTEFINGFKPRKYQYKTINKNGIKTIKILKYTKTNNTNQYIIDYIFNYLNTKKKYKINIIYSRKQNKFLD